MKISYGALSNKRGTMFKKEEIIYSQRERKFLSCLHNLEEVMKKKKGGGGEEGSINGYEIYKKRYLPCFPLNSILESS